MTSLDTVELIGFHITNDNYAGIKVWIFYTKLLPGIHDLDLKEDIKDLVKE